MSVFAKYCSNDSPAANPTQQWQVLFPCNTAQFTRSSANSDGRCVEMSGKAIPWDLGDRDAYVCVASLSVRQQATPRHRHELM